MYTQFFIHIKIQIHWKDIAVRENPNHIKAIGVRNEGAQNFYRKGKPI